MTTETIGTLDYNEITFPKLGIDLHLDSTAFPIGGLVKPGKIKITASVLFEGSQMPASAVLELESKPAAHPLIYTESEAALIPMSSDSPFGQSAAKSASELEQERLLKERNAQRLKEVEKQQADFGEKK